MIPIIMKLKARGSREKSKTISGGSVQWLFGEDC
jgi:hypothetical protein